MRLCAESPIIGRCSESGCMRCRALSWPIGAVRAGAGAGRRGRVAGSVLSEDGLAAGRVDGLRAGAAAGFLAGAAVRVVSRGGG